jgi:hypothetical protein
LGEAAKAFETRSAQFADCYDPAGVPVTEDREFFCAQPFTIGEVIRGKWIVVATEVRDGWHVARVREQTKEVEVEGIRPPIEIISEAPKFHAPLFESGRTCSRAPNPHAKCCDECPNPEEP